MRSDHPGRHGESSTTTPCEAPCVVDSREAVLKESGDVILSRAPIYAEAGEIFAGSTLPPALAETTVFKSVGIAVEDLAAARLV
jgi:thiomorpholine-carboxylate dehydrogenase